MVADLREQIAALTRRKMDLSGSGKPLANDEAAALNVAIGDLKSELVFWLEQERLQQAGVGGRSASRSMGGSPLTVGMREPLLPHIPLAERPLAAVAVAGDASAAGPGFSLNAEPLPISNAPPPPRPLEANLAPNASGARDPGAVPVVAVDSEITVSVFSCLWCAAFPCCCSNV